VISRTNRLLRKGHRALAERRFADAIALFRRAALTAPDDPRCAIQLALALARSGQCEGALETTAALAERFADNAVALALAGRSRLECGDPAGAEPLLASAARSAPENLVAARYLALCRLLRGETESAKDVIESSLRSAGSDFLALLSYEISVRLAPVPSEDSQPPPPEPQLAERIARLESQASGAPADSLAGRLRRRRIVRKLEKTGEQRYDRGDFAGALAAFEAARRLGSKSRLALLGAGLSALEAGAPHRAVEHLAEGCARWPGDAVVSSTYGFALLRAGRREEALEVFEKIEPAGPDDFHAHYARAVCLAALGRKTDALEQFRTAFEHYRLDTVEECLVPAWREFLERQGAAKSNGAPRLRPDDQAPPTAQPTDR